MSASSTAIRRLRHDYEQLEKSGNPQITVRASDQLLEWHFVLHDLPEDTVYAGGCYHGMLKFPEGYPMAPPSLYMMTPNGRLETNQRLCLSMTDFHPESWNPAWTVESILVGLLSFMVDERDPKAYGAVHKSPEVRRKLAQQSVEFNRKSAQFCELFPEFAGSPGASSDAAAPESLAVESEGPAPTLPSSRTAAAEAPAEVQAVDDAEEPRLCDAERDQAPVAGPSNAEAPEPKAMGLQAVLGSGSIDRAPGDSGDVVLSEEGNQGNPAETGSAAGADESVASSQGIEECWICREGPGREPLIQPCACRGSMSGVHASCVESWIAHHRSNALHDEMPKCSVCHEPYCGEEKRPGIFDFFRHLCADFTMQAVRSALLVLTLVGYWTASQEDLVAVWIRVLLFCASGGFFTYKSAVLMVSLPRGYPVPRNCLRFFHTTDFRLIAINIAETMAILVIAGLWCIYGQLAYWSLIPLGVLAVLPLITYIFRQQGSACSVRTLWVLLYCIGSPVIVVITLSRLVFANPRRLLDPFDGLVHILVPMTVIPLCWFCSTNMPVICLWSAHTLVLLIGICDKQAVRKGPWKEGRSWWIFLQFSVLAAYIANLLNNFSEGFLMERSKDEAALLVLGVSLFWLLICAIIVFLVNWKLCIEQYHTWQNRNGRFSLSPPSTPRHARSPRSPRPGPQTLGNPRADADPGVAVGGREIMPQHEEP